MFIFFLKTLAPSFFFCEFRIFGADVLSIRPLNWHLVSKHVTRIYLASSNLSLVLQGQLTLRAFEQAEADKHVFRSDMKYSLAPSCGRYRYVSVFQKHNMK